MPNYKRLRITGGSYFFTVNLHNRNSSMLVTEYATLMNCVNRIKQQRPFKLVGWVALPEHLHCIWTLPENDLDFSGRWREIKKLFTKIHKYRYGSEAGKIWQHRFWEHYITSQSDFLQHLDYIHINPVKHGHVNSVKDWPYSSFHFYVRKGLYSINWAGTDDILKMDTGERCN